MELFYLDQEKDHMMRALALSMHVVTTHSKLKT